MASTNGAFDNRWIAAFGFVLVLVQTVILFRIPPAPVYEMSIYDALPWPFWVLLSGTLFLGFVVIVQSAYNDDGHWRYGLLLVFTVLTLFLFLPYFRGYPLFGRGDALTHVGLIKDIENTGAIGDENFYPSFHTLALTLAYATGAEPMRVLSAIPAIVSLLSVASSVALVTTIYDRTRGLLTFPFVTVLVTINPVPWWIGALAVPFVLYLFAKERQTTALPVRAALVLILVGMVIYHPLTSLFLLFIFAIYGIARLLHRNHVRFGTDRIHDTPGPMPSSQFLFAVFAVWYVQFRSMIYWFQGVVRSMINPDAGKSSLETYSSTISEYSPALTDLVRIGLLRHGRKAVLFTAAGFYCLIFLWATVRDRVEDNVYRTTFVGSFGLFAFLSVLFFVIDFPVGHRSFALANLFGALLAGALFYTMLSSSRRTQLVKTMLYAVIAAFVVISVFGVYPSPYSADANAQVTETELDGTEWFLDNRNGNVSYSQFGLSTDRYRDALYGRETHADDRVVSTEPMPVPPHFNYTEYDTLGDSYNESQYLILSRPGRIFYPKMYPDYSDFWKFTPSDFDRLERDSTVDHVYASGGYDAYLVNGTS